MFFFYFFIIITLAIESLNSQRAFAQAIGGENNVL